MTQRKQKNIGEKLLETGRLYVALKMGCIASEAAEILRLLDVHCLLGQSVMVIGTTALTAYEIESTSRFALGMDSTYDFDLACLNQEVGNKPSLFGLLKKLDSTYTINSERTFQARNSLAYEVEILAAPSSVKFIPKNTGLSPRLQSTNRS